MAFSALRANSSTATRLSRYKHHMQRARALEAEVKRASTHVFKVEENRALTPDIAMTGEGGAQ
jgi:hypothetical protein